MSILDCLKLPETKRISDLDDVATSLLHAEIIRRKGFLKKLYIDFYMQFKIRMDGELEKKTLVELGSGGGFIKDVIPNVITSDVQPLPHVDKVFSGTAMPFADSTIDGFFLINVLHHIHDPRAFFREIDRTLKPGGKLIMIEPANTAWSRFIFKNFHHENFDPQAKWELDTAAPLSCANDALAWIIFRRDRAIFQKEFPALKIAYIVIHTPLLYLLSGGLTLRQLLPSWAYRPAKIFEQIFIPRVSGMFQTIELVKSANYENKTS